MGQIVIFDSAAQNPALITTAYNTSFSKAVRVRTSPLVFFCSLTGSDSVQVQLDFSNSTNAESAPSVADASQWYTLVNGSGATVSTEFTILKDKPSIIDLSSKFTDTSGAIVWKGWVPPGPSYMRVQIKRTGVAVTSLKLVLANDSPQYANL